MQASLERAMLELAFGPELTPSERVSPELWLEQRGVSKADAEAILEQGFARLLVYRDLVRGNLREAVRTAIPRTVARMGPLFDEYFERFLREQGPRTHYLRDVTRELLDFCEPLWADDTRVDKYLLDLAHHEAVQVEIGAMQTRALDAPDVELALDRPLRFIEAARLARYDFAVHRLSDDESDRSEPEAGPVALFVYRSPEHEVRYLETSPLAAAILERLLASLALGEAIREAAESEGIPLDENVLAGASRLLADLAERGALLGAAMPEQVKNDG